MIKNLKHIKDKIKEYIKFNIIGISNFLVSQILYLTLFIGFKMQYLIAYTITSIISICASYLLNSKFTFKEKKFSFKKFILSILIYIFEYGLNLGIIISFVNLFNMSKVIAPIIAPAFSTPPVFFLMRYVIKNKHL